MQGRFPLGQTNGHFGFPVWLTLVCFPLTLHNLSPIVKSLCIPHRFLSSPLSCNLQYWRPLPQRRLCSDRLLFGRSRASSSMLLWTRSCPFELPFKKLLWSIDFSVQKTQRRRGFFPPCPPAPACRSFSLPSFPLISRQRRGERASGVGACNRRHWFVAAHREINVWNSETYL